MNSKQRLTFVYLDGYPSCVPKPPRDRHIPDLVSLAEAAQILGVSRQAVHKMATKAQLLGTQVGTTWVFRRVVVERAKRDHHDKVE
jgi:hypothetical protein